MPGRKKILLLVFIHGFQGDDNTFGEFPEHLKGITKHTLTDTKVVTKVFPRYETRGELSVAVSKLRSWHQDLVLELETHNETPQPLADPVVRTIFVCHSMGGIVAADTMFAIMDDPVVPPPAKGKQKMFPRIQGILAFDTPYLGLMPGMFAHSANGGIQTANAAVAQANAAVAQASAIASSFFGGKKTDEVADEAESKALTRVSKDRGVSLSSPSSSSSSSSSGRSSRSTRDKGDSGKQLVKASEEPVSPTTQTPAMARWSKLALFAGAVGALAAGGAAAYMKREEITLGFGWVSSHFEFVRELGKMDTMRKRLARASSTDGVGFANFYTSLGKRTNSFKAGAVNDATTELLSKERTFCSEPSSKEARAFWFKMVNTKANDEIGAHTGMFSPTTNPGYYTMSNTARDLIVEWAGGPKLVRRDTREIEEKEHRGSELVRRHTDEKRKEREHRGSELVRRDTDEKKKKKEREHRGSELVRRDTGEKREKEQSQLVRRDSERREKERSRRSEPMRRDSMDKREKERRGTDLKRRDTGEKLEQGWELVRRDTGEKERRRSREGKEGKEGREKRREHREEKHERRERRSS